MPVLLQLFIEHALFHHLLFSCIYKNEWKILNGRLFSLNLAPPFYTFHGSMLLPFFVLLPEIRFARRLFYSLPQRTRNVFSYKSPSTNDELCPPSLLISLQGTAAGVPSKTFRTSPADGVRDYLGTKKSKKNPIFYNTDKWHPNSINYFLLQSLKLFTCKNKKMNLTLKPQNSRPFNSNTPTLHKCSTSCSFLVPTAE